MTATGTPPPSHPTRPQDKGAPAAPSARLAREDLRVLFKRYYGLLGFTVSERDGRVDVSETGASSPAFSYVFDRKSLARNQGAKLVTFNSQELEAIINAIKDKGKIARAYMPFEFEPKVEFQRAIEQLQAKSNAPGGFVNNGTIHLVKHYIGYVPVLMYISRVDFSSVDASTEIERATIPLIDQGKLPDKIKQRIAYYVDKLGKFFDSEQSRLVNHMPVAGELLEIPDEQVEALVEEATPKLLEGIKSRTSQVEGRLQARLQKEIGILENYYKQLKAETADAIEAAREKRDKEKVTELEQQLEAIEKEQKFKKGEFESIYRLSTQFEVLGAAAIYVPIFFQFHCKIKSVYGDIDYALDYNIFDKEIVPPTCTCGNPIYQGHVCSNLHFSCTGCTGICAECKADICSACKPKRCKECNTLLCETHAVECDCCADEGTENRWTCKAHSMRCDLCGKTTCHVCRDRCTECGRITCYSCGIYYCKSCGKVLCPDHARECVRCLDAGANKRWSCADHARQCAFCGGTICMECAYTCAVCNRHVCEACGVRKCRCGDIACKDHCHECPSCVEKGKNNPWVCDQHTYKCDFCNAGFCGLCIEKCTACGRLSCAKCGIQKCRACGNPLCKDHSITCRSCEVEGVSNPHYCQAHASSCDLCGQPNCLQHLSEKCSVCGKVSCPGCGSFKCRVCRKPLCKQHARECAICKGNRESNVHVCNEHLVRCYSCGKDVCVSCSSKCAKCGRITCKECGRIDCKECGSILCVDHAVPCDKCKGAGKKDLWSCADHVVTCDVCNRHLCLKCEPGIARCNVCGKAMCTDCKPHRCKDCNCTTCNDHHGECSICKTIGRAAIETCVDHTYTCTACGKVICKEHSIACDVCQEIFCTDERCSDKAAGACIPHTFVSAFDGIRHPIKVRMICNSCHLAYDLSQMGTGNKSKGPICKSCTNASRRDYYLYLRRSGNTLIFPDFLDVPGDASPTKVVVNERPFTIPGNQRDVLMAENAIALIFLFGSNGNEHTLVHVKGTGFEILYTRPNTWLKLGNRPSKAGIAPETVLKTPSIAKAPVQQREGVRAAEGRPTTPTGGQVTVTVEPHKHQEILDRVQKLFKASIRIKLDMLQRVLKLGLAEFNTWVAGKATDNGLFIESSNVVVEKTDVPKFLKYVEIFLSKR